MPNLPPVFTPPRIGKRHSTGAAKKRQQNRALATNHPRWRRIRKQQLQKEPLCREHKKRGQIVPATQVDHIDGDAYNNDPDNFQSLCHSCHSKKTMRERNK